MSVTGHQSVDGMRQYKRMCLQQEELSRAIQTSSKKVKIDNAVDVVTPSNALKE